MGAKMAAKGVQKAVHGLFFVNLYVQVVEVCTACAAIYCRETCTRLVKLIVQLPYLYAVHTLKKCVQRVQVYSGGSRIAMKCDYCKCETVEYRRALAQNGGRHVLAWCIDCERPAWRGQPFVSAAQFTPEQIEAMPVAMDYRNGELCCAVKGCDRSDVELHHYAPRALFDEECEEWPTGYLCTVHHDDWHKRTQTGKYGLRSIAAIAQTVAEQLVIRCPACRQPLAGTAIVDALNDPPGWSFWGNEGARWIVCQAAGYVHFRVDVGRGQMQHRLAIIKPGVAPRPVINL